MSSYTYNANGECVRWEYQTGETIAITDYTYKDGICMREVYRCDDLYSMKEYTCDESGKYQKAVLRESSGASETITYFYDENHLLQRTERTKTGEDNQPEMTEIVTYTYDERGCLCSERHESNLDAPIPTVTEVIGCCDGRLEKRRQITADGGKTTATIDYSYYGVQFFYQAEDGAIVYKETDEYGDSDLYDEYLNWYGNYGNFYHLQGGGELQIRSQEDGCLTVSYYGTDGSWNRWELSAAFDRMEGEELIYQAEDFVLKYQGSNHNIQIETPEELYAGEYWYITESLVDVSQYEGSAGEQAENPFEETTAAPIEESKPEETTAAPIGETEPEETTAAPTEEPEPEEKTMAEMEEKTAEQTEDMAGKGTIWKILDKLPERPRWITRFTWGCLFLGVFFLLTGYYVSAAEFAVAGVLLLPKVNQRFSGNTKTLATVGVILSLIVGVLAFAITEMDQKYIAMVKEQICPGYSTITYGDALESFFDDPSWAYIVAKDEDTGDTIDVVEFTGIGYRNGAAVTVFIQFTVYSEDYFEATYLSYDDVSQTQSELDRLMRVVIEQAAYD
ncbi:MAG: hypothetical protein IJ468_14260 [Lachnospiraceae bacterium]|nr:hypothetical protein [Lachnospiraceae bacterium]